MIPSAKGVRVRFEVFVGAESKPILNVFLEDGRWFPIDCSKGFMKISRVHPKVYERVWGKPIPQKEASQ